MGGADSKEADQGPPPPPHPSQKPPSTAASRAGSEQLGSSSSGRAVGSRGSQGQRSASRASRASAAERDVEAALEAASSDDELAQLQEMERYKMIALFEEDEIRVMRRRFDALAVDGGAMPREELLQLDELCYHPLRQRILELLDFPESVDFESFLRHFSVFSHNCSRDEKSRFAFRVWDWDGDGVLNEEDLSRTLGHVVGNDLSQDEKGQVVSRILNEQKSGYNEDGHITYETFLKLTLDSDLRSQLTFELILR